MSILRNRESTRARSQHGAALVTSLLLLLVLTIIGITTMQMSRMQERMAGNTRDINAAFQGAEAAARGGEAFIRGLIVKPVACSAAPCTVWMSGTAAGTGRVDLQPYTWWDANATATTALPELKANPAYVVEEVGHVRTDGGVVLPEEDARDFYQVSGRSTGASGLAEVVIQTTFTRRF
jgi:type IV pilus assembly protein PilX